MRSATGKHHIWGYVLASILIGGCVQPDEASDADIRDGDEDASRPPLAIESIEPSSMLEGEGHEGERSAVQSMDVGTHGLDYKFPVLIRGTNIADDAEIRVLQRAGQNDMLTPIKVGETVVSDDGTMAATTFWAPVNALLREGDEFSVDVVLAQNGESASLPFSLYGLDEWLPTEDVVHVDDIRPQYSYIEITRDLLIVGDRPAQLSTTGDMLLDGWLNVDGQSGALGGLGGPGGCAGGAPGIDALCGVASGLAPTSLLSGFGGGGGGGFGTAGSDGGGTGTGSIGSGGPVHLATVLAYLSAEILELAGADHAGAGGGGGAGLIDILLAEPNRAHDDARLGGLLDSDDRTISGLLGEGGHGGGSGGMLAIHVGGVLRLGANALISAVGGPGDSGGLAGGGGGGSGGVLAIRALEGIDDTASALPWVLAYGGEGGGGLFGGGDGGDGYIRLETPVNFAETADALPAARRGPSLLPTQDSIVNTRTVSIPLAGELGQDPVVLVGDFATGEVVDVVDAGDGALSAPVALNEGRNQVCAVADRQLLTVLEAPEALTCRHIVYLP